MRLAVAGGISTVGGIVLLFTSLPYILGSLLVQKFRWPRVLVGICGLAMCIDLAERIYVYGVGVNEAEQNFVVTVLLGVLFSAWVLLAWGVDAFFGRIAGSDRSVAYQWTAVLVTVLLIGTGSYGTYRFVKEPPPEALERVEGPEDPTLEETLDGTLLVSTDGGALHLMGVPPRDTTVIVPDTTSGYVSFADGPSASGTVAFIESHMDTETHQLKVQDSVSSQADTIFEREGDVLWKQPVGPPALSPQGHRVALVRNPTLDYQSDVPHYAGRGRFLGTLELWGVEKKTADTLRREVQSHSLSWLDERRLVVTASDSGAERRITLPPGYEERGMPLVTVVNVETGTQTPLLRASHPIACAGGESLLVRDGAGTWWRVDLTADTLSQAQWPGNWKGAIGCSSEGHAVYWGLPTQGTGQVFAPGEGADRVPAGDVKVAMMGTRRFATLVRGSHPASEWIRFQAGTLRGGEGLP